MIANAVQVPAVFVPLPEIVKSPEVAGANSPPSDPMDETPFTISEPAVVRPETVLLADASVMYGSCPSYAAFPL